jgi:oligopeptidase A
LLTHDDVVTLFHEFGHGLHHLLTQVDESSVAGINGVPWDAVELPSQFLENWCWEAEALNKISGHFVTGAPLPPHLLDRMRGARNFQSAMQMLRQIEFSVFDMTLHDKQQIRAPEDIQNILDEVRNRVAVLEAPAFNRFQNSFSHIFAGGYAAGYYSYKWAEVLSADAFGRFEEDGILDAKSGQDFLRSVLETGGVNEPLDNFTAFRGRPPSIDALLRHSGLGA